MQFKHDFLAFTHKSFTHFYSHLEKVSVDPNGFSFRFVVRKFKSSFQNFQKGMGTNLIIRKSS